MHYGNNECIITSEIGSDGSCGSRNVSESRWMVRTGTGKCLSTSGVSDESHGVVSHSIRIERSLQKDFHKKLWIQDGWQRGRVIYSLSSHVQDGTQGGRLFVLSGKMSDRDLLSGKIRNLQKEAAGSAERGER